MDDNKQLDTVTTGKTVIIDTGVGIIAGVLLLQGEFIHKEHRLQKIYKIAVATDTTIDVYEYQIVSISEWQERDGIDE